MCSWGELIVIKVLFLYIFFVDFHFLCSLFICGFIYSCSFLCASFFAFPKINKKIMCYLLEKSRPQDCYYFYLSCLSCFSLPYNHVCNLSNTLQIRSVSSLMFLRLVFCS
uniref:Putative ovule protein n=1 Tax=Solanum chacoense TaxID=4108 RepID=A0A0V0HSL2_SOLCH